MVTKKGERKNIKNLHAKKKNCSVINYVNKINTFRNIQQEAKKEREEKKEPYGGNHWQIDGCIIQATQDIIQGLTVSAGLTTLKQKLYFSCASHEIINKSQNKTAGHRMNLN